MVLTTDRPPSPPGPEVLIPEARRHRRQRWIAVGCVITLALVGTGVGWTIGHGAPPGSGLSHHHPAAVPSPPTSSPSAAPVVVAPILKRPQALAVDTDGSLLIANQGTDQILRWTERGGLSLLAGKGTPGYAGDGGLATKAELNQPSGMAVAPDGTIYVADTANNALRMISPRGVISTLARVKNPQAVALSPDGALYVVDSQGVDEVSPTGSLTLVLPSGPGRYVINGTATAFIPWAIAIDGDGDIYVGNLSPKLLMEFSAQGQLLQSWTLYVTPAGLATAPDGSLLIGDYGWFRVDRLAQGQLTPVAELEAGAFPKLGGFRPSGVAVGTDGTIYADDDGANGLGDTSLLSLSPGGATKVLIAISPPTVVSP